MSPAWREACVGGIAALGIAWAAACLVPDTLDIGPYAPRAVAAVDACRSAALAAHPGRASHISSRVVEGSHRLHVTVEGDDTREHVVVCDGVTGAVLRDVDLDREARPTDGIK